MSDESFAPLRLLQVGLGARGQMWVEIIDGRPDTLLAGAVDINPAARAAFVASHPGVPTYPDLEQALAAQRYDAVVLVTPPQGRLAELRRIIGARLPVLAEKPLTQEIDEAVAICRLAHAAEIPLVVGLNFRYLPVSHEDS